MVIDSFEFDGIFIYFNYLYNYKVKLRNYKIYFDILIMIIIIVNIIFND